MANKPLLNIILALFLCILAINADAQKKRPFMLGGGGTNYSDGKLDRHGLRTGVHSQVHHLFGGYLDGSYSAFHNNMPNVYLTPGGYGVGGGLCYEMQIRYFKAQIGVGVRYQNVSNYVRDTIFYDSNVVDARVYPYLLKYEFRNRKDSAWCIHAQIPLLFGSGITGFYFLTGFKFNYTFSYGESFVKARGETSATYPQYLGHFVEMDNHGLRKNVPIERKGDALKLKMDILYSFEIGGEFGRVLDYRSKYSPANKNTKQYETRIRLAAFIDYSIFNIMPKQDNKIIYIPASYKWDFPEYQLYHVFSTTDAQQYWLRNLYAGIKFTILIGTYSSYDCILCGPWESEVDYNNRKIPHLKVRHRGSGLK